MIMIELEIPETEQFQSHSLNGWYNTYISVMYIYNLQSLVIEKDTNVLCINKNYLLSNDKGNKERIKEVKKGFKHKQH